MPRLTGGQAVVESLRREGIDVVFGLPGLQVMCAYDAFYGRSDIRLITVRHEQATTYMADAYARVTGKPAAALVVPGPGVQNASAGLGTAYACSSPLLLIAGQIPTSEIGRNRGVIHEIDDQLDVVRPLAKWCHRVMQPQEIPGAMHEAMRQMKTGRPRPTVVEVPQDVLEATADIELMEAEDYPAVPLEKALVRKAAELLHAARKPIIWAGGGVILANASDELTALAEALKIPVITTPEGKGAIPEDHPLCGGVGYLGHGAPGWLAPRADVVLAVGTRLTDQMRGPTAMRHPQKLIHIDADPDVIGKNYPAEIALAADARVALKAIREAVAGRQVPERWPQQERNEIQAQAQAWLREVAPMQGEIIADIQKVLKDDALIVSGITNIGYWSHFYYRVKHPRTYFTPSYYATIGYAFPFALGAKVAAPGKQVVSISGDGGFSYALSELATAVKYGINVVAIVFVDGAYGASIVDQQRRFGGRIIGTELHNPDFARVAEIFGANGIKAQPQDLGPALAAALESKRPTVIEVPLPVLPSPARIPARAS